MLILLTAASLAVSSLEREGGYLVIRTIRTTRLTSAEHVSVIAFGYAELGCEHQLDFLRQLSSLSYLMVQHGMEIQEMVHSATGLSVV